MWYPSFYRNKLSAKSIESNPSVVLLLGLQVHLLIFGAARILTKKWLHVLKSGAVPRSNHPPKLIATSANALSGYELCFVATLVVGQYLVALFYNG